MRQVADSILTSVTHSWKENGHEKNFYDHYLPSAASRKGSCQLLAKECALTILVNCLGGLPGNSVDRLLTAPEMTLKASKSRKTPTLQQNTFKGLGSRTCRIGPVNRQNIKVAQQKWHRTFLCAEYFYFHEQHLFSCVNPLLLCYRMLNMDRVAIFLRFLVIFTSLIENLTRGTASQHLA